VGFEPSSVSFISPTTGFVLGASSCGRAQCAAVLTTVDGGRSWSQITAPAVGLSSRSDPAVSLPASVDEVVFANRDDGWAYDPGLWSTTDAGTTWHQVRLGLQVAQLVVYGKEAFAVVWHCEGSNDRGCSQSLDRSSVGSSEWAAVPGLPRAWAWGPFAGYGASVWVALPSRDGAPESLWHSTNSGGSWRKVPDCPRPVIVDDLAAMAAVSASSLFEVCVTNSGAGQQGKDLRFSDNAGASSVLVSKLGWGGYAAEVAAANTSYVTVSATSNASFLYDSFNGGKSWKVLGLPDGGAGLDDLQYAGPHLLAVVDGYPPAHGSPAGPPSVTDRLLMSRDGGGSWAAVTF
jgi:hypothetical protein